MLVSRIICYSSSKCQAFRRVSELALGVFGASISVGMAAAVWQRESTPGENLWPLPAIVLIELGILGLLGLAAVVSDSEGNSNRWGPLTWAIVGGLAAVMLVGAFSIGPLVFPAVLAFSAAGLLADWRHQRRILENIGVATLFGIGNFLLLLTLIIGTAVLT